MRIFLIMLMLFSSSFDPCMIEEVSHSTGATVGQTIGDDCVSSRSTDEACKSQGSSKSHHENHTSHEACQHCHGGHVATMHETSISTPIVVAIVRYSMYAFNHDSPSFATLRRPPKA